MERQPKQKEFGEVRQYLNKIEIQKFGQSTKERGALKDAVGEAAFYEMKTPVPHYKLARLDVYKRENQGRGFASQLLSEMEELSRTTGLPVVLEDGIVEADNPEAVDMYGRRKGWIEVKNLHVETKHYIFGDEQDKNVQKLVDSLTWK